MELKPGTQQTNIKLLAVMKVDCVALIRLCLGKKVQHTTKTRAVLSAPAWEEITVYTNSWQQSVYIIQKGKPKQSNT